MQATKSKYERPTSFPHVMPEAGAHQGHGASGCPPPPPAGASFGPTTSTPPPGQGSGPSFGAQHPAQAYSYAAGALRSSIIAVAHALKERVQDVLSLQQCWVATC